MPESSSKKGIQRGFATMLLAAGVVGGCEITMPRMVPPGNVWTVADTLLLILLLAGAVLAGFKERRWYELLVLGAASAACFDIWLPDRRQTIGIGFGTGPSFDWYVRNYVIFILIVASVCAILTLIGSQLARYLVRDPGRCQVCNYDLRGLPEPRCPECGTPFDPAIAKRIN